MAIAELIGRARQENGAARVAFACIEVSLVVLAEGAVTNHAERLALAKAIMRNETNSKLLHAHVIATSSNYQDMIEAGNFPSDTQLRNFVSGAFTQMARLWSGV